MCNIQSWNQLFFECILATGFLFEIQQSKKQLFILTAFSRSEISKMTVRCSNNGEFLHQKVPLNTQWKILSPRLISKNLSNAAINFFLQKKQLIEFTSCFTHKWVISLSRTLLLKPFWGVWSELTQQNNSATYSKHVKLPLVSFFQLRFLRNVSSKP